MASQDEWAKPLADELVDVFRVSSLTYFRVSTGYDPATGEVTTVELTYTSAGAVTKMTNLEAGGVGGPQTLECWVNLSAISNVWPTTADSLQYDGRRWKITQISPMYSGDTKYAAKLQARSA